MSTTTEHLSIVKRTAQKGLDDAKLSDVHFSRQCAIWALDIVCEMSEADQKFKSPNHDIDAFMTEVGDTCWGIYAIALLFELNPDQISFEFSHLNLGYPQWIASDISDYLKKVARDNRVVDKAYLASQLSRLLQVLHILYGSYGGVLYAMQLVDSKLKKRYPNGFTAEASINRVV